MPYELHIVRPLFSDESEPTPISVEEWKAAIAATQGVRLFAADAHTITNPATGEVISIAKRDGDAEVYFPTERKWMSSFRWFEGSAKFNARFIAGKLSDPVWIASAALATSLGAIIRGDDGEQYDLKTAERIRAQSRLARELTITICTFALWTAAGSVTPRRFRAHEKP